VGAEEGGIGVDVKAGVGYFLQREERIGGAVKCLGSRSRLLRSRDWLEADGEETLSLAGANGDEQIRLLHLNHRAVLKPDTHTENLKAK